MKSFVRYFVLIICFCFFTETTSTSQVDDTPGGNLTVQFREFSGRCPSLPDAEYTPHSREMYEGRWYLIQAGFLPSQIRNLNCFVWDSFFDQQGNLHNFISGYESGQFKTITTRLTPVRGRHNVYSVEAGAQTNDEYFIVLYFVDGDIFVLGEVACKENGNHYRNIVIGVRDLRIANARATQLSDIVLDFEYESAIKPDKTRVAHSRRCVYPDYKKHPYKQIFRPNRGNLYPYRG